MNRKWTFGVAAGALLVAGTFAAGALGLNSDSVPVANSGAPEHAPSAPGNAPVSPDGRGPGDIGTPAVAAPPHGDHAKDRPVKQAAPNNGASTNGASNGASQRAANGSAAQGSARVAAPAPAPATPAPPPAPAPQAAPAKQSGTVEKVVKPVTDTVGHVTTPITDTVGGLLSPVTSTLSGGGAQPAMTMINPLGDLLGS